MQEDLKFLEQTRQQFAGVKVLEASRIGENLAELARPRASTSSWSLFSEAGASTLEERNRRLAQVPMPSNGSPQASTSMPAAEASLGLVNRLETVNRETQSLLGLNNQAAIALHRMDPFTYSLESISGTGNSLRAAIDKAFFAHIRNGVNAVNSFMSSGARAADRIEEKYGPSRLMPGSQHLGAGSVNVMTSLVPQSDVQLALTLVTGGIPKVTKITLHWYDAYRISRSLGANPFKGKTFEQIAKRLEQEGFIVKGKNPAEGKGAYYHPQSNRKYYLDRGRDYAEGFEYPHVDVHRRNIESGKSVEKVWELPDKGSKFETAKRKYPLEEKLQESHMLTNTSIQKFKGKNP